MGKGFGIPCSYCSVIKEEEDVIGKQRGKMHETMSKKHDIFVHFSMCTYIRLITHFLERNIHNYIMLRISSPQGSIFLTSFNASVIIMIIKWVSISQNIKHGQN